MKRAALAGLAIVLLTACGSAPEAEYGTEPREGWVEVYEGDTVYKRCDGSTLLYWDEVGLTAVPSSSECSYG